MTSSKPAPTTADRLQDAIDIADMSALAAKVHAEAVRIAGRGARRLHRKDLALERVAWAIERFKESLETQNAEFVRIHGRD